MMQVTITFEADNAAECEALMEQAGRIIADYNANASSFPRAVAPLFDGGGNNVGSVEFARIKPAHVVLKADTNYGVTARRP